MQITVGTDAVQLPSKGRARLAIQNLGPGILEFDTTEDELVYGEGIRVAVDTAYEFLTPIVLERGVWLVADADADVRVCYFEDTNADVALTTPA